MAVRCRARGERGHLGHGGIRLQSWRWYGLARLDFFTSCELFPLSLPRTAKQFNDLLGATLLQKLTIHERSLPSHTPSGGSFPGHCYGSNARRRLVLRDVLLGFVAVLRTGGILPINWVHVHWCPAS